MMGFTGDGQIDPAIVTARDERFGVKSEEKKASRADIAAPAIAEGADGWQHGKTVQIADPTGIEHGSHGAQSPAAKPTTSKPAN